METPVQITFHNLAPSAAIENLVREKAAGLNSFHNHILNCRVVIAAPHQHHERGNLFHVRLDLAVPGEEIVVNRDPGENPANKDVAVALRDVFDAAARQLEDYVRRRRGHVKTHAGTPHGKVIKLFPDKDYGFLQTLEGREIYFHRHSVLHDGFDKLTVGSEVAFAEEEGKKGPQASTVKIVGRHGHS